MKIAITGSGGLVGAALADDRRKRGDQVLALVRSRESAGRENVYWN